MKYKTTMPISRAAGEEVDWIAPPGTEPAACGRPLYFGVARVDGVLAPTIDHAAHGGSAEDQVRCVQETLKRLGITWSMEQ